MDILKIYFKIVMVVLSLSHGYTYTAAAHCIKQG